MKTKKQKRRVINPATDRRFRANRVPKPLLNLVPERSVNGEGTKKHLERAAARTLADVVAEYIENNRPITHLTGHDGRQPDPYWVEKIANALEILGYKRSVEKLRALLL